jgi:hypothetical protein
LAATDWNKDRAARSVSGEDGLGARIEATIEKRLKSS